ncbi:transposable element Tcb2 transposase [Trichonephila clavipes]|nr:transposable element Tcb2 transposase [Trichonephila clavipes]
MGLPFSHTSETTACQESRAPIMCCKRSRALRGRQTRDERNEGRATMGNLDVKKESEGDYGREPRKASHQPGSEHPLQSSRREDRHIVGNARVQTIASSAAIQAQVASSLGAPVSSRTIRMRLAEGHLGSRRLLRVLPLMPNRQRLRLELCRAQGNWTAAEWN